MILVLFMNGYWKVADFGLTSEATSNRLVSTSASRGKPCYRAPEMLRETSPGFNNKMDMWSFGCIAHELLTGRKAFSSDYEVITYSISKKKPKTYFKHIDSITKFYISDLFELDPDNRPAARELLKLKFSGETPLTKPTQSTTNRSRKKRHLEQQSIPQSVLLIATLEWADSNGKTELILTLLGCGINPLHNMVTDGMNLLMQVASFRSLGVVERFRRTGFEDIYPGLRQAVLKGAAPVAAEKSQWEVVKRLVEYGTDVSANDNDGWTGLHSAAHRGHKDVVELLLEWGADVVAQTQDGWTALHRAAWSGHKDVVALLLDKGADVDATNYDRSTALHLAALSGHKDVVALLLDIGADVAATGNDRSTALYLAASSGHKDVVALLLDRGADVDATCKHGSTALHQAASSGHRDVVALLLDKGADVAAIEVRPNPARKVAWPSYKADMVSHWGAKVAAKDQYGLTALHRAAESGHKDVIALLLDKGADVDATDDDGSTALHRAAESGHKDVVALFLDKGADVNATYYNGSTALHLATWSGHKDVVALLLDRGADDDDDDDDDDSY
jgi:ankyrin repeat protein